MKKSTSQSLPKRPDIGGQAVMEGVMMKAPDAFAVAVRKPDGTIFVKRTTYESPSKKHKWMGLPFIRGAINLVSMLKLGMTSLQQSTDMLGLEDEEPTKFEKWLSAKLGKGIDKIVMFTAIVLAIIFSVGLFYVLPAAFAKFLKSFWGAPEYNLLVNFLTGLVRIIILLGYIIFCGTVPDVRRTFMYHGAEHKTVYCNENDLPLTPENAQTFTTLHPRCGTSFLLIVFILSFVIYSLIGYQGSSFFLRLLCSLALFPVASGVSYEVLKWLAHHENPLTRALRWPGMQLQRLTTKQPTLEMLEVAIVSMNVALHGLPKYCETNSDGYTVVTDYRQSEPDYVPPTPQEDN